MTPLVPVRPGLWCKLEYVSPTRSFKDRGAAVMISGAADQGVRQVVADSSGNAGAAVAAYAGRAGMAAEVFVPEATPAARVAAIEVFGARVVGCPVIGPQRPRPPGRAVRADRGLVRQPRLPAGLRARRQDPGLRAVGAAGRPGARVVVVVPAGNGTLVLGLWLGFRELAHRGHIGRPAAIVAVQAERCAPLAGLAPGRPHGRHRASPSPDPPGAGEARAAILASGGAVVTVAEEALEPARRELARLGMRVEPTAAVAWAAGFPQGRLERPPGRADGGGPERGRL